MEKHDADLSTLEARLGYQFKNIGLLETAMTHSSYANERRADHVTCYERLEFLGDSILGFVAAEYLWSRYKDMQEGQMTRLRAELVCEGNLHRVAQTMDFSRYMRLGRGEERTGGRTRVSVQADMVEAVIAAMYLDSGMDAPRKFIMDNILSGLDDGRIYRPDDYKSELQELAQRDGEAEIRYELIDATGPDHCKLFTVRVYVKGEPMGDGTGHTKKEAEQLAAKQALEVLKA